MKITKLNILLFATITIGAILRFYNLTAIALWHDEAFSALLIRYPLDEMIRRIALDVHPPLYYFILRAWDIFLGDSLFSLRLFSVFFGILTVYFSYLFIRDAFKNERLAIISVTLIAFNPFQIQYSVESRMYTFGTFLIILSSWLLVKALKSPLNQTDANDIKEKNIFTLQKYRWWFFYGFSAIAAIYTHYYLIFSVIAQALFIFLIAIKKYGKNLSAWFHGEIARGAILAYSISFILFIPWLETFLKQLGQVEKNYWIPKINLYSVPATIYHLFAGTNIDTTNANLIIFSLIFLAISIYVLVKEKNNYKWLVVFSFFIPFVIAIIISVKRSLYLDRYFVFVGLFYCIIIGIFLETIKKTILIKSFLILLLLSNILFFAYGWQKINPNNKTGMNGATKYIFANIKPDEKVYITSTFIFFTYKYYAYQNFFANLYPSNFNPGEMNIENNVFADERLYPNFLTPLLYTPDITALDQIPHFSGTALLTENDLLTDFNKNIKRDENIWVLWTTGFGGSKPTMPSNWTQISETGFQDVFDYKGWIIATKYKLM